MKKIIYLLFLAIGVTACSVESIDSTENLLTADFSFENSEFDVVTYDYRNPQGQLQGTLSVSQDCSNLYVAITGNPSEFQLGVYDQNANPPLKQNGDIAHGSLPHNLTTATNYEWVFQLSSFTTGSVKIFARGWGGEWAGDNTYKDGFYLVYDLSSCDNPCVYGKGYWENHSSNNPGEQEDMWPVSELMLGNNTYSQDHLNEIMDVPNNEGNSLVIFSQHLIAAKLNVANGAGTAAIAETIQQADELIGDLVVLEDSFSDEEKTAANLLKDILEAYNESGCN